MIKVKRSGDLDPFDDFDRVFEDMRRRMEEMFSSIDGADLGSSRYSIVWEEETPEPTLPERKRRRLPVEPVENVGPGDALIDVWDNDSKVTVLMEMPGSRIEDIGVEIEGKRLVCRVERSDGAFALTADLPCSVRPSSKTVTLRNGVLQVVLEKSRKRAGPKKTVRSQ